MKVFIEKENKTKNIMFEGRVKTLLEKIDVNPETVIVTKENRLITEDEKVKNSDSIKILSVISGG